MFSRNTFPHAPRTPPFALAIVLGLTLTGCVTTDAPVLVDDIVERVVPYVRAKDFMGVVAIARGDDDPLLMPFGEASVELGMPHRHDGVFMIGSISKQFTAAALLALEEDGKLQLSDPIALHLSEFAEAPPDGPEAAPSIHQLLSHTAGIADTYSLPMFGASEGLFGDFEQVVDALAAAERTNAPGAAYAYSNGGYVLAAAVVERVSGRAYGTFLRERFFEPLGLRSIRQDELAAAQTGEVPGYQPWGIDSVAPIDRQSPAFATGAGSLWSNASDLVAWTRALHNGRVLSQASYARLTADYGNGYGYGMSVFTRLGQRVYGHDGRIAGFAADAAYYPDENLTIVVLSNVESVARDIVRVVAAASALGVTYTPPERPQLESGGTGGLDVTGTYRFGPGLSVRVYRDGRRLLARANEGGASELVPLAREANGWFSRLLYTSVCFEEGAAQDDAQDGGQQKQTVSVRWGCGAGPTVPRT